MNKLCFSIPLLAVIAQGSGSISGTVVDPGGAVIPRCSITLHSVGIETRARSNEEGRFILSDLKPGKYSIEVEHPGFRKFAKESIRIGKAGVNLGKVPLGVHFIGSCDARPAPQARTIRGPTAIEGRISTMDGVLPSEVTISVGNPQIDQWIKGHIDSQGRFIFVLLSPGTYDLSIYLPITAKRLGISFHGIVVQKGRTTRIIEPLKLAPCEGNACFGVLCL